MRRISVVLVAVALAACGSSGSSADPTTAPPPTEPVVPTEPPATAAPATEPPATEPPATEPPATEPPATEPPATDAPATDPAELELLGPGPYDVGVATVTITDEARERPLTMDIWFPIADAADKPPQQYTLLPGVYYESPTAVVAVADDLAPDGPFPLVVYSHGSGGLRYLASYYTEAIASHGYVVAAPDHAGNTAVDRLAGSETSRDSIAFDRPQDVAAVIDAMTDPERVETAGLVAGVDPERIAVTGHSFGGFTAYAMAGGFSNSLGSLDPDPRVDAIITLAPASDDGLLPDARLASIVTPALIIAGTDDKTTPIVPDVTRPWDLSSSIPHRRVDLVAAEHQSFTDLCDYQRFLPSLPEVPEPVIATIDEFAVEGCSPDDMPIERAKALTNTFAINFLDAVLKGGELLRPEAIVVPDDIVFLAK